MTKYYGSTLALSDAHLRVERGSVLAVVGHNGAGKSTLLRSLSGAERPDAGRLLIGSEELHLTSPADAAAMGIACVYQELSLVEQLTVSENLFLGREQTRNGRLARRSMNRLARSICDEFAIDAHPNDRVGTLSVAQRQMLEVARAVHRGSRFLLLDEPTTALELGQVDRLLVTLRRLAADGLGIVFVNHKLNEVFAVADQVVGLADGRVVLSGPTSEIDRAAVVRAVVGERAAADHRGPAVVAPVEGANQPPSERPVVFRAEEVGGPVLANVSLTVHAGEIVGIYGLVGSSRSRFLRTVYGMEPLTRGTMTLDGRPYHPATPLQAVRSGVAYLPEERKLDGIIPQLDTHSNAALPVLRRFVRLGVLRWRTLRAQTSVELAKVAVRGNLESPLSSLSGGNQQKVLFARATLQRPTLLLLDEPTKGVDIGAKTEIYQIIRQLAREQQVAIIIVSTEVEEVLAVADSVAVFRGGWCDGSVRPAGSLGAAELRELAWSDALENAERP
ncbi:MAG: sugar ABC transporter ATP-binding protein [Propionicimonas sp.]|uniref:sugar ABC transporter ATP-binding protein n=1 Tax=Propionicimonas sp. TaxID=1955623 RepID=UPI002B1F699B|nr:sugar ABC transporter ATP-binding protein [Propionicimonas sp.]MEA4943832.1 sugar ABC transporter ATP-binding protein [Propionicimonas sp.]